MICDSLCDSSEAPLYHEGCVLVLHEPRLLIQHGRLGEDGEDLGQPSVANGVEERRTMSTRGSEVRVLCLDTCALTPGWVELGTW